MPKQPEQEVFLVLSRAYQHAFMFGKSHITVEVDWIGDVLCYLDSKNNDKSRCFKPLDDYPQADIEKAFAPPPVPVIKTDKDRIAELEKALEAERKTTADLREQTGKSSYRLSRPPGICAGCDTIIEGTTYHVNHKGKVVQMCEPCRDRYHATHNTAKLCDICGEYPAQGTVDIGDGNRVAMCKNCYNQGDSEV